MRPAADRSSRARPTTPTSWQFELFVADEAAPHTQRAVAQVQRALDRHIAGSYDLTVTDLRQHPERATIEQLIVLPALIRRHPEPALRLTGDFSDESRVAQGFGLGNSNAHESPTEEDPSG